MQTRNNNATLSLPCQLNILRHDSYALRMDRTKVGIFEQSNKVRLGRFLERQHSTALEPEVTLKVLCDFTHETLKGQLPNQQIGRLLIPPDLTEGDRTRTITVRLLHTASRRRRFPCRLRGELFPRSLSSGRFTCGLFFF